MECEHCGDGFERDRDRIQHVLESHTDEITSHEEDSLKRELNRLDDGGESRDLPLRMIGIGVAALTLLIGGGYLLSSLGILSLSVGGGGNGGGIGPAGSTHDHAQFSVFVNGEEIDFSQPRYQTPGQDPKIHFEGGDGSTIHKHATGVTIGFALERLGMGINSTCLTVHDQVYCENSTASLKATVNGDEIEDAAAHVIQDGEVIRLSYGSE